MSVRYDCDELIICEDGPFSESLAKVSNLYITHDHRLGHPGNLWSGIVAAQGKYVGILDFDVEIKKGSMRDLCFPGMFVSAKLLPMPSPKTGFLCWCSVIDRSVLLQHPMLRPGWDTTLLDSWADSIPYHLRMQSDAVEYEHHSGIGAEEFNRVHAST